MIWRLRSDNWYRKNTYYILWIYRYPIVYCGKLNYAPKDILWTSQKIYCSYPSWNRTREKTRKRNKRNHPRRKKSISMEEIIQKKLRSSVWSCIQSYSREIFFIIITRDRRFFQKLNQVFIESIWRFLIRSKLFSQSWHISL